jgi:hypothetical protein
MFPKRRFDAHLSQLQLRHAARLARLFVPSVVGNRQRCTRCAALVEQKHGFVEALAFMPLLGTSWLTTASADVHALRVVMWSFFLAAIAGISIWGHCIRYRIVDEGGGKLKR